MPKKNWTEEEKKAFAEKMKAARVAKKKAEEVVNRPKEQTEDILPEAQENDLVKIIEQMKEEQALLKAALLRGGGPQVGARGIAGVFEKYIMDPDNYPDPCERLFEEPMWAQRGLDFKNNYFLKWTVEPIVYERLDGVRESQPKFTLKVLYKLRDPETGEFRKNKDNGEQEVFTAAQCTYFEDPEAAFVVAREHGMEVDKNDEKTFLDEMRYLRLRDWLFGAFFPRPVKKDKKSQEVIGNRVVDIFTISSETTEVIPFNTLKKF